MAKTVAEKILLGEGIVSVGGTPVGLTRGGSKWVVEREFREIEADGDRGPVKGRIVIDKEVAKMTVNALEPFSSDELKHYWPALNVVTSGATHDVMTGSLSIVAGDYNDVTWSGFTKDGKAIVITVEDALNMGNLEWGLEDKNEVVPALEFTGTYDESTRTTPPWSVQYGKAAAFAVTITATTDGATAIPGATVVLYGQSAVTNASGVASFANIPTGTNYPFTITRGGYEQYFGALDVAAATDETVTMTAIS